MRLRLIIGALLLTCLGLLASGPRYLKLRGFRGLWVAAPWTPADQDNMYGWWKADALTNTANGSEVAFWTDSSGHSLHLKPTATGSGVSPYFTNSFQNGLPAVFFDGTNDKLTNIVNMEQTNLVFMVLRHHIPSASKAVFFDGLRNPTDHEQQEFSFLGSTYKSNAMEAFDASGVLTSDNPGTNIMVTYVTQWAVADSKIWTNGVLAASGAVGSFGIYDGMVVGCSRDADNWYRGYMMEMFCITNMYASQTNLTGRTVLDDGLAYLRQKWAHY